MNLYRHIDRTKVQFDFVKHTSQTCAFEDEIISLGGRIYKAPCYKVYNYLEYGKWWRQHFQMHPEHQIIHGHYSTISSVYFKIAKLLGRVTIAHSHNTENKGSVVEKTVKRFLEGGIEKISDYCFSCSRAAGKWLFPNKEFTVLNNAIDSEKFRYNFTVREETRTELGLGDSFTVGIVGSLSEVKNPFGTIEIFKAIHNRRSDAKLLWVGGGGMEQAIKQKLTEENLTDAVIMTGVRSDVDRLMQAMDVFIFPSFSEGLGMVAIEAQAAGLTCFCSNRIPKEVGITELCQFLPLGQPDLWVNQIFSADLSRKDTCQAICNAGYDIHTTAKMMEEFYLDIAGV